MNISLLSVYYFDYCTFIKNFTNKSNTVRNCNISLGSYENIIMNEKNYIWLTGSHLLVPIYVCPTIFFYRRVSPIKMYLLPLRIL